MVFRTLEVMTIGMLNASAALPSTTALRID